ncbi:MAG: DEAD/DEAH box helicase, partial [Methylophilaceae bacterium]
FIEEGLIYRLPWGLEAIRVRAQANQDVIADGAIIDDYEVGLVVPAIESGTLNRSAALLMQAGFNSRKAAIQAVRSTNATFTNSRQFKRWLTSDEVFDLASRFDWPTPETSTLWWKFVEEYQPTSESTWNVVNEYIPVVWLPEYIPQSGSFVKILNYDTGKTQVLRSDGEKVGLLQLRYDLIKTGIYY